MSGVSTNLPESLFPVDSEVTVTITGRVVHADAQSRGLVVEVLNSRGFPDRIVIHLDSEGVAAGATEPATPEQVERRRSAYRRMADAFRIDPEEQASIRASAPYGGLAAEEVTA